MTTGLSASYAFSSMRAPMACFTPGTLVIARLIGAGLVSSSPVCPGSRSVRAGAALGRGIAWRIHQVA